MRFKCSILLFVIQMGVAIFISNAFAQTNYDLSKQHEKLCKEIYETSKLYELRGRLDDAIRLLEIGIEISQEKEGSKCSEAMLKSQLGNILRLQRHFDEALPILLEAQEIAESVDDQKIVGDCLFYIGYLYDHKQGFIGDGDYNTAKEYYEQSLALRESIEDQRGIGFSLFRIGRIFEMQDDEETAMSYYKRAQKIAEEHDFKVVAIYVNAHQGFISEARGSLDEALKKYQHVLEIKRQVGFIIGYPFSFIHLGRIHYKKGDKNRAIELLRRSINSAEKIGVKRTVPWSHWEIANVYFNEAENDSALHHYGKAVSTAEELGIKNFEVYESLIKIGLIHLKKEDYKKSIEAFEHAATLIEASGEVGLVRQNNAYLSFAYTGAGKFHDALKTALINLQDMEKSGIDKEKSRTLLAIAMVLDLADTNDQRLKPILTEISSITKLAPKPNKYFETAIQAAEESGDDEALVPALYEYGRFLYESDDRDTGKEKIRLALEKARSLNLVYEQKKISKLCSRLGMRLFED
ncbi:MAG: tetratricopeptide repeat protein [Candidatus Aminicenantes bacterium]|nr:MAG: tetratricopeptide repeat protein [Candidatus Aminicenantes bacterium]